MNRVLARSLVIAIAVAPLGGCLTISWQDDPPASVASAAPSGSAPQAPQTEACDYNHGWDSTSASRDIYGNPKEYQCPKSTQ